MIIKVTKYLILFIIIFLFQFCENLETTERKEVIDSTIIEKQIRFGDNYQMLNLKYYNDTSMYLLGHAVVDKQIRYLYSIFNFKGDTLKTYLFEKNKTICDLILKKNSLYFTSLNINYGNNCIEVNDEFTAINSFPNDSLCVKQKEEKGFRDASSCFQILNDSCVVIATSEIVNGYSAVVVKKIICDGSLVWKSIIPIDRKHCIPVNVFISKTNDIYALYNCSRFIGVNNPYIVKYDSKGKIIWKYDYYEKLNFSAKKIIELKNDDFLLIGDNILKGFENEISNSSYVKIDNLGNIIWQKEAIVGINSHIKDALLCDNKEILLAGIEYTSRYNPKTFFAIKLNVNGEFLWKKKYHSSFALDDIKIMQSDDKGFLLFYNTGSVINIFKIDNEGNQINL